MKGYLHQTDLLAYLWEVVCIALIDVGHVNVSVPSGIPWMKEHRRAKLLVVTLRW